MVYKILFLLTSLKTVALVPALHLQPHCEIPCGPNADCVRTDYCVCRPGYNATIHWENGLPFCKPLCELGCMEHAECVEPNVCACRKGYELHELDCTPICSSGCPNGFCREPELCDCYDNYKSVGSSCVLESSGRARISVAPVANASTSSTTQIIPEVSTTSSTDAAPSTKFPISSDSGLSSQYPWEATDTSVDSVDGHVAPEIIHNSIERENDSTEVQPERIDSLCSVGFVYHEGACRPQLEEASDEECNLDICGPHTHCVDVGRCACLPGYDWQYDVSGRGMSCVSLVELSKRLQVMPHEPRGHSSSNFITCLGVLCVLVALIILLAVLYKHRK